MWNLLLAAAAVMAADLPIREVVLYKHGVGYFQRTGRLGPGESARLDFKAGEMNDVLKSLTVVEGGGGRITGLRYDSSQPVEARLADFPFKIGEKEPLSAVLDQLKGARLELKMSNESVAGSLVAARIIAGGERQPEREQVTLLLDSGDLRNFDLAAASSIRFADPRLQLQFQDYLRVLADARAKEKRSVYIDSSDRQAREITAGYMLPVPVWKSSYRLILAEAGATLEGWAIVDNTTAEDWKNVRLSLVSGRPVSFISKLYEPRYARRPVAELEEEKALAPQVYDSAMAKEAAPRLQRSMAVPPAPPAAAPLLMAEMAPSAGLSSVQSAEGREMGELFEYRIGTPVTVRKDESAMLPFLQQKLEARKLLIYSDQSAQHPMNAAELTNITGKTLDGGPITIYDGGYAGEALVETVKAGDKRLISYAMDLGTNITTRYGTSTQEVREVHLRRGVLTSSAATRTTTTYTIRNVDAKAKTLMIERQVRPGLTLVGIEPSEKTARAWRFEVKLAPSATREFPVTEEWMRDEMVMVTNSTPDALLTWTRNKGLSDAGRKQLEQIAGLKRRMAEADGELQRIDRQMDNLSKDQERIRQNIRSLAGVAGQEQQVQGYARQLAGQEAQIAGLRDRQAEQQRTRTSLEGELNRAIETANF